MSTPAVEHTSRRASTSAPLMPSISRGASLGGDVEGVSKEGDLLCVEAQHTLDRGLWALDPLVLSARSCALNPIPPSREG